MSARKKNITLDDLVKLGPKKLIIILIAAAVLYFSGNNFTFFNQKNINSDIVTGIVERVVDGDTAIIRVGNDKRRVRFLGVDTPETVHPKKGVEFYGKEASSFTKNFLTGKRVWLEYDKSPTDRYNRHLAYIWMSKPENINEDSIRENMFNARLLIEGYAKVMIIKPNSRYANLFNKFQYEARKSRKGLWTE